MIIRKPLVVLCLCQLAVGSICASRTAMAANPTALEPVKIYILAGQSNAETRGSLTFLKENFPELAKPHDDIWNFRPGAMTPAPFNGPGYNGYDVGFGACLGVREVVDNDIILMGSAVGGTMLYDRWRPPSAVKRLGGEVGDLYSRLIKQVHSLVANLEELYPRYKGQGYELAGFIWFQGENDCCAKTQGLYRDSLMDLIKDVRTDLGVPNLPVVLSKINDGCWGAPAIDIWAANEYAAHADPNTVAINTRDLRPLCHYDSQSYLTIGQRIGKALQPFAKKTVHTDDKGVRAAARAYFARHSKPAETHDMSSLEQGLVDYWKFDSTDKGHTIPSSAKDGTAGTTWFGAGRQGKQGPPQKVAGKFGQALKLKSANKIEFKEYRDPVNAKGEIEQMSIAFWAKTTGGDNIYRIGKGTGQAIPAADRSNHNWYWSRQANKEGWDLCAFDSTFNNTSFTGNRMVDGKSETYAAWVRGSFRGDGVEWHHQVVVYDGLKRELRLYRDGKLSPIVRCTVVVPPKKPRKDALPLPVSVEAGPLVSAKTTLTIGGLEFKSDQEFQIYDELAIWSRPLTEEEVKKLYNNGHGSEIYPANPLAAKSLVELGNIVKENPDAEVRYDAVRAAATRGEEATQLLIRTLNDKSPGVRYGAAQSLGERGYASLDLALGLLKHRDKQQRVLGTIMLKHIGKRASPAVTVPALVTCLKDEHFDVRMNAADALAVLGDWAEAAVPALIEAASDEEWWVRREACMALASINTPEVRSAMVDIVTAERHAALGWQDKSVLMKHVNTDPTLQDELAHAYGKWLLKEEGYINTFAARGKFGSGISGLERLVKEKKQIPDDVVKHIRRVLADNESAAWTVDDKSQKRLEAILESIDAAKGAK